MGSTESQLILVTWQVWYLQNDATRKEVFKCFVGRVNYCLYRPQVITLHRPASLMGFACRDFLTSLMIWAWRHQLHPASDLILTNLCIELVIFCQGVASFPRSSGGDRILISHGPRLCHGSLSSSDMSCHLVITCHHPDIRQPAAKLVCVLEKRGNCKPVTDCWLSKAIWPGDHRLIMRRIFQSIFELKIHGKAHFVKTFFGLGITGNE